MQKLSTRQTSQYNEPLNPIHTPRTFSKTPCGSRIHHQSHTHTHTNARRYNSPLARRKSIKANVVEKSIPRGSRRGLSSFFAAAAQKPSPRRCAVKTSAAAPPVLLDSALIWAADVSQDDTGDEIFLRSRGGDTRGFNDRGVLFLRMVFG